MTLLDDLGRAGLAGQERDLLETYLTDTERSVLGIAWRAGRFGAISREELVRRLEDEDRFHGSHADELELMRAAPRLLSLEEKGLVRVMRSTVLLTASGRQVCKLLFGPAPAQGGPGPEPPGGREQGP